MSKEIQALALALALATPLAASAADAMRVVRDPVTGELRGPTAAEAAAFAKAEAQLRQKDGNVARGQTEIKHANGAVELKLGEDTMMFSVVSTKADGTLQFDCLPADEARTFVSGKTASSKSKTKAKVSHDH